MKAHKRDTTSRVLQDGYEDCLMANSHPSSREVLAGILVFLGGMVHILNVLE